jgi:hypothetical protein
VPLVVSYGLGPMAPALTTGHLIHEGVACVLEARWLNVASQRWST